MRQRGEKSRQRWLLASAALTVAIVGSSPAPAAAIDPAVDEYIPRVPDAKKKRHLGPKAPQLGGLPEDQQLKIIAKSPELGAPAIAIQTTDEDVDGRGFFSAALSALGGAAALILLALLVVVGAGMFRARRASR